MTKKFSKYLSNINFYRVETRFNVQRGILLPEVNPSRATHQLDGLGQVTEHFHSVFLTCDMRMIAISTLKGNELSEEHKQRGQ